MSNWKNNPSDEGKEHELIYTQEDMNEVLEKLRAAQRNAELTNQLLWATVQVAGGEVKLPYSAWVEAGPDGTTRELAMWDDAETYALYLKIIDRKEQQDDGNKAGTSARG